MQAPPSEAAGPPGARPPGAGDRGFAPAGVAPLLRRVPGKEINKCIYEQTHEQ